MNNVKSICISEIEDYFPKNNRKFIIHKRNQTEYSNTLINKLIEKKCEGNFCEFIGNKYFKL